MPPIDSVSSLPYAAYRQRRHFAALDGFRALSILAVVWHHTVQPVAWLPMTARGFLGVDMFFVLSGFLIVTLLLRERDHTNDISLPKFYMRRTLRIFPVYYAILFALAGAFLILGPNSSLAGPFLAALPYYLTYTADFIHIPALLSIAWSLAAEEQFYLIWPPLEKFLRPYIGPILAFFLIINQLINFRVIDDWLFNVFSVRHADLEIFQITFTPILLGVVLAHLLHQRRTFDWLNRFVGRRWAAPGLVAALLVMVNILPLGGDISGLIRLTIHLLMTLLLAATAVNEKQPLVALLARQPLVRIGKISYGMYLFHMLVRVATLAVVARLPIAPPLSLFVLTLVGTLIIAELSYRFYEAPILRRKQRWSVLNQAPSAAPASGATHHA